MYLSVVILMLVGLAVAPLSTVDLYRKTYDLERRQIAADNAGIVLGQADRDVFNGLVASNRRIDTAEEIHHALHACALSAEPSCVIADRAIEKWIQAEHLRAFTAALRKWISAARLAMNEFQRLEVRGVIEKRRVFLPVRAQTCSVCGLANHWEVAQLPVFAEVRVFPSVPPLTVRPVGVREVAVGRSLVSQEKWNYRLEASL